MYKNVLYLLIITALQITLVNCNGKSEKQDKADSRVLKKTIKNERFKFIFEIPQNWKTAALSDNGDGFYILIPGEDEDIRIYGEELPDTDDTSVFNCTEKETFNFYDGVKGIRCNSKGDGLFILRSDNGKRVIFYCEAEKSFNDTLIEVAKSIRFY